MFDETIEHCFKNRTGPAGSTVRTVDRSGFRSGLTPKTVFDQNRSEPFWTVWTGQKPVIEPFEPEKTGQEFFFRILIIFYF